MKKIIALAALIALFIWAEVCFFAFVWCGLTRCAFSSQDFILTLYPVVERIRAPLTTAEILMGCSFVSLLSRLSR